MLRDMCTKPSYCQYAGKERKKKEEREKIRRENPFRM
jgi:hypothetical protein